MTAPLSVPVVAGVRLDRPRVMGVVNVTPDSFSDGGAFFQADKAVAHGLALAAAGADFLDVGGESTRPGADDVPEAQEIDRVVPVIEGLVAAGAPPVSIDTRKPAVMRAAAAAGARILNDVSALTYADDSCSTAADLGLPVILMHAQGAPKTMQDAPRYDDVVSEVVAFLEARRAAAVAAGVDDSRIVFDPGVGFGKTLAHNLALIARLDRIVALGRPVLFGASRKSFIAAIDDGVPASERLGGSLAAALAAVAHGARILRVHDVAATRQALKVFMAIEGAARPD
ncbi:MAG: dihydropteroate synthase [Pseudomonadota bacterium]